jgi:endoglucanase
VTGKLIAAARRLRRPGLILAALAVGLHSQTSFPQTQSSVTPTVGLKPALRLGIYDPHGAFKDATGVVIEHIFIPWEDVNLGSLAEADNYARERKRQLLISVEPWSWAKRRRSSPVSLRDGIKAGKYDETIKELCSSVGRLSSPVIIRWAHEMDLANARYPWANWDPDDYISAYRYFVNQCRKHAPSALFMWSPRGERNLTTYYPGPEYVDSVGISIFGLQTYDEKAFGQERTLRDLLAPTYELVVEYKKPIYIAEFGCSGDANYVAKCADFSAKTLQAFPNLVGVIYFSDFDTGVWPRIYGRPDWRVRPEDIPASLRP